MHHKLIQMSLDALFESVFDVNDPPKFISIDGKHTFEPSKLEKRSGYFLYWMEDSQMPRSINNESLAYWAVAYLVNNSMDHVELPLLIQIERMNDITGSYYCLTNGSQTYFKLKDIEFKEFVEWERANQYINRLALLGLVGEPVQYGNTKNFISGVTILETFYETPSNVSILNEYKRRIKHFVDTGEMDYSSL